MNETLTTGQMLDNLNYGDFAVNQDGAKIKKLRFGFAWCDENDHPNYGFPFLVNVITLRMRWEIIPGSPGNKINANEVAQPNN